MRLEDREAKTLLSTGEVAKRCGVSVAVIKHLELSGRLTPALRISGSDRRAWFSTDLPEIRRQVERRAGRGRPRSVAA